MWCTVLVGLPLLVLGVWIGYHSIPSKEPLKIDITDEYTWEQYKDLPFQCSKPIVIRNALKMTEEDKVKYSKEKDPFRKAYMTDKLLKVFGEKQVSCYAMSNLSETKQHGIRHTPDVQEMVTIRDYMTNDKYVKTKYVVNALAHLGTHEEYHEFMSVFANKENPFQSMISIPESLYMGTQYFIGRGKRTGSHMHFAWGVNVFFMLSGRKHWVVVDPAWAGKANCTMGHTGIYGHCWPNHYMGDDENGQVNISKYLDALEGAGLPRTAYEDFILEPGDLLINCDLWPHVIENLTPETMAISGRYKLDSPHFSPAILKYMIISAWNSATELYKNPNAFTWLGSLFRAIRGESELHILDKDPKLKGLGVLNQKDPEHNVKTKVFADKTEV